MHPDFLKNGYHRLDRTLNKKQICAMSGPVHARQARLSSALALAICLLLTSIPAMAALSEALPDQQSPPQDRQSCIRTLADNISNAFKDRRRRLQQAGISVNLSAVLEGFNNFRGGLKTFHLVGASTVDASLTVDTEKLINWQGGKFYVDLEDHAGRNPSTELVGDLQIFDKLNSGPYLQVFELWYQQKLFDGKLRLKAGKADANSEFSVIDNGLEFLNSSTQVSPTVFLFPTTPDPMPAANLFFTPWETCYAGFGVYYSNRSVTFGNFEGRPEKAQLSDNGVFLIGETGLQWRRASVFGADGNLKLGAWGHTGTFTRFDGERQQGTYGWYAILDQTLWQPEGASQTDRGLRIFLEYGRTQQNINAIDWHTGGGLAWTGLLAVRPRDVVGFSPQYAHISKQAGLPHSYELAMEWFYTLQVTRWAALQSDLQYIINPGGQYPDAVVGTIRLAFDF
jgi:porin